MSDLVKRNARLLQFICKLPSNVRKHLIKHFDRELICSLNECAHNTLRSNVPLTKKQKSKLKEFKRVIRRLAKPVAKWRSSRKYIKQVGSGFLPLLLTPILTAILQSVLKI